MFNYLTTNCEVTWVVARIPADKIVDGRVAAMDVEGEPGLSFGGWTGGMWRVEQAAKQSGEARYLLPVIIGFRNGGAYVAQYVQGRIAIGVDPDGKSVPVPIIR